VKYLQEYRDPEIARKLLHRIESTVTRPWVIMEICGGQTHAIVKHGIDQVLPKQIELVHGPGCPVCVTPLEQIDKAIEIALKPDVIFTDVVGGSNVAFYKQMKAAGVTVTCLMPGATETEFFARADMLDTAVGQGKKDDAADVARTGFKAMMNGEGDVVSGWHNKLQSAIANVVPASILAEQHRKKAAPGSGGTH